jgi:Ser/Thr protein kinase RdoA (MazF antagonist)
LKRPFGYNSAMPNASDFSDLTPDTVINAVEDALDVECTSVCRPLNSYINRVYEVALADGGSLVAKFYRPGRWSRTALQDELDFLHELAEDEVPVISPLVNPEGDLLHKLGDTSFAVFPKKGGRPLDEPSMKDWEQLGRLIGRMHVVGARREPQDRIHLHPENSTVEHLNFTLDSGTLCSKYGDAYEDTVNDLIDLITPLFEDIAVQRIHGDCHRQNILYRPGEGYHLLDFDDMAVGPAVHDLWLMLPDRLPRARPELDRLLEGYETFVSFDHSTLKLIEPLRVMRYIHFTAWCAHQKADGGFARLAPDWGTSEFWGQEIDDLMRQRQEILDSI